MTRLEATLRTYLERIDQLQSPQLGGERREASPEDKNFLLQSLRDQQQTNQKVLVVAIVVLCSIFVLGVFLVLYYRDSPKTVGCILGGNFFTLLLIVGWLRRLWLEKSTMDALFLIVSDLSPREAAKVITSFYFRAIKMRGSAKP